jgi:hypothetical protein
MMVGSYVFSVSLDFSLIQIEKIDEIHERQEFAALVPLIKAARGEEVKFDRVKHAIVNTLDLAINKIGSDKQAHMSNV